MLRLDLGHQACPERLVVPRQQWKLGEAPEHERPQPDARVRDRGGKTAQRRRKQILTAAAEEHRREVRREQEAELEPQLAPIVRVADIGGMAPIRGQPLGNHRESPALGEESQPQLEIRREVELRVQSADPIVRRLADQRGRVGQEVARHPRVERVEVTGLIHRGGVDAVHLAAVGVDLDDPGAHDIEVGTSLQQRHLPIEFLRQIQVVRIHRAEIRSAALRVGDVVGAAGAVAGPQREDDNPRIVEPANDRQRVVLRPVVDDHQLPVRIGLSQDGPDRLFDVPGVVVHRGDDRDQRRRHQGRHFS